MITLKDGSQVEDEQFDRIYELDWNSLDYPVTRLLGVEEAEKKPRSYTWALDIWLDQGREGACVGFGYAHEAAATPVRVEGVSAQFARERVYWPAQRTDEWPGGSYQGATPYYEGTSVLSGAKVMQEMGLYTSYYWALDIKQLVLGVGYTGPAVIGVNWYEGMLNTVAGWVRATGKPVGGHCICVIGVKIVWKSWVSRIVSATWDNVDLDRSYLKLHNSWGRDWGVGGRAMLSLRDADKLLNEQGDACFPLRNIGMRSV